ncbi:MAG: Kelch repeat-containing protein [Gammaproteobacteria bacterium]
MTKQHNLGNCGQWKTRKPLAVARSHCPTVSYKGKIYGFGGGGPDFKSLNSVVIYDPGSDSWSAGTDMPTLRSGSIAKVVGDAVYIIGGGFKQANGTFRFLRTTEIYHPDTDRWEQGPDMLMPHDYPAAVVHHNAIYVLGGHHPDANLAGPKTDPGFNFCERLNLETGQWEQVADLPTPRFALDAITQKGRILTFGGVAFTPEGFNNFDHIEEYDPGTNQWCLSEHKLPWTAAGLGACVADNKFFIFGGYSGDGICDHAAVYDPDTATWHPLPPIPQPLAAMGVTVMGNRIYLLGGWADDGRTPQHCFYEYQF